MTQTDLSWDEVDGVLRELVEFHKNQLLKNGRRIIPHLTSDDLLQPNDFQELEFNPHFRYEEGIVAGIQAAQMALWAFRTCSKSPIG